MKTKRLLSALFTFSFFLSPCFAQIPQGFNYQAIARDSKGNPITNTTIKIKLSILTDTMGFYMSGGGTYLWEEEQPNIRTNAFGQITVVFGDPQATKVQGSAANFSAIDWAKGPLYIGIKIANPTDYKNLGSAKLWSVPYSMVADSSKALLKGSKLSVVSANDGSTDALFEVKRKDGQTVFAVYPNAVNVYVPRTTPKGVKGGFAIGGFDGNKITPQEYLRVTPDSVRIYIDKTPNIPKGTTKGGFAIGGFDQTKNTNLQDLLTVSNDSIRMYINDLSSKGTTKGGFAIGGFDQSKGSSKFMNVSTDASGVINPSQNRILWYPLKNAFLTGKVLIEKPDSVGQNSFASGYESKAPGQYSQALGYQAVARGSYSTSIGYQSVANKDNSFAFGQWAQAKNQESYALGKGAIAEGYRSFAFGSAGVDSAGTTTGVAYAKGDYSFAIGQGSMTTGFGSIALGLADSAKGNYSLAMGYQTRSSGWTSTSTGSHTTASGNYATATGNGTIASGWASTALGYSVVARSAWEIAVGSYNTDYNPVSTGGYNWSDRIFVVGNGYVDPLHYVHRRDAFMILKTGYIGMGGITPSHLLHLNGGAYSDGTTWVNASDKNLKENFEDVDALEILSLIDQLPVRKWNYISDNPENKHIGPVAQDFYSLFGLGNDDKSISSIDPSGIALVAIQELSSQNKLMREEIESTKLENQKLRSELDELKALVSTLVANQTVQGNK